MRLHKGKEPLREAPDILEAEEEIPYEEEIVRKILPYGIAANLYAEDDENGITNVYRERYLSLLQEIGFAEFAEVEEKL